MNVPAKTPPRKSNRGRKGGALTPLQEIEAWSWYQAKLELGGIKKQALRMGVPFGTLSWALKRMRMRERNQIERVQTTR